MIHIVTDGMSDISQEDAARLGIDVLPLPVRFGDEEFWDGIDLTKAEFFRRLRACTELPKTSQVPLESFRKTFEKYLAVPGDDVLCITGSLKLSGCNAAAVLAQQMCSAPERVTVVDSWSATAGEMQLVLAAVARKAQFESAAALGEHIAELRGRQRIFGQAMNMKYLVMGGRINPMVGKVGQALSIKPMLKFEDGAVEQAGLVRSVGKARAFYLEQLQKYPPDRSIPMLIAAADDPTAAEAERDSLLSSGVALPEIQLAEIGATVGTYVGPGLIAIAWIAEV